jgi:hypothetical protein
VLVLSREPKILDYFVFTVKGQEISEAIQFSQKANEIIFITYALAQRYGSNQNYYLLLHYLTISLDVKKK